MKKYRDIVGDGGSNIVGQVEEQRTLLQARMASIRRTIAVVSGKGGVGKSSVTSNLAATFASQGRQVGVMDADINGPSIAKMLGVRGQKLGVAAEGVLPAVTSQGIRVMSMDLLLPSDETPVKWDAPTQAEAHTWRGGMEANAIREFLTDTVWGSLDFLLLDLPPGTDRLATVAGILPGLSGAVIVTIPSEVSHLVVKKSITVAKECKVPILGLIENMAGYVCQKCGEIGELFRGPGGEALAEEFDIPFLGKIPFDPRMAVAADQGVPFVVEQLDSLAARAFIEIARKISAVLPLLILEA
ncbi:MAG TPA: Mrp/NBP35 family ATP-binding protein [Methylomirabilota bacterium]|nr:Mrp/NBP35 family ATP-binding protein [Methylomirabilota bacterium]